jgi:hypothetical protein
MWFSEKYPCLILKVTSLLLRFSASNGLRMASNLPKVTLAPAKQFAGPSAQNCYDVSKIEATSNS